MKERKKELRVENGELRMEEAATNNELLRIYE